MPVIEFTPKDRALLERLVRAMEAQAGFAAGAYQSQKRVEQMLREQAQRLQSMADEANEHRVLSIAGRPTR